MFYLTTHSTHFIYGYMASDIWLRTILIVRKEGEGNDIILLILRWGEGNDINLLILRWGEGIYS